MTTISASSTIGLVLTSPSYANPVVINSGVTISSSGDGIGARARAWMIENAGSVEGTSIAGISLNSGGSVTNAASGLITGGPFGVIIFGGAATVVNYGSIAGIAPIGTYASSGVELVSAGSAGLVINAASASITGVRYGVRVNGGAGTVVNAGSIATTGTGTYVRGVELLAGGSVTNAAFASISGYYDGISMIGGAGTVVNYGSISGVAGNGVYLNTAGSVTNEASASIAGATLGVCLSAGGTLTNAGMIVGNTGTAVVLGGTGSNLLVLDPGFGFAGLVSGGANASNTLELASGASAGTLTGLGSSYVGFGQITVGAFASWMLDGTNTIVAGATLTELSGANLIDTGTITNDGTINATSGTVIVQGTVSLAGTIAVNGGSLSLLSSGAVVGFGAISGALSNAGTIEARGGLLDATGPITDTGGLSIQPAATLELGGATSQSVTFDPTIMSGGTLIGGTLKIDAASSYTGTIYGFAAGDTIDFAGLGTANVAVVGANNVFAVFGATGGQATLDLDPTQDYSDTGFANAPDGSGGTDVTPIVFKTIDDPNALYGGIDEITTPKGINDVGEIVGDYIDYNGFVETGGTFTTIVDPNDIFGESPITGINDAGQIVGRYADATGDYGFLDTDGSFSKINDPSAIGYTVAYGIDDAGQIVGNYKDASGYHGFEDTDGSFTTISDPNAAGYDGTSPTAINNAGQIVGYYEGADGSIHGFLDVAGNFTTIDDPNATGSSLAYGINDAGQIVGEYSDVDGDHGFVDTDGAFTTINYQFDKSTVVTGINDVGQIVGYTQYPSGALYIQNGFVADIGTSSAPCFAAGTRIATDHGEVAVETIRVGHKVRVLMGDGPAGDGVSEVIWVGRREVDCARHQQPRKVWPVRVAAGAFGPGLPHRYLWLSPDHAVYVGEVLIPVRYLVNGSTIAQVPMDRVTYHHIELAEHDVVLAEGLPAESFLDMKDGSNYANRAGPVRLYPDFSARMWEAFGCARLIVTGAELEAARALVARFATEQKAA